mgnify:CR=1 FL=1
MLIFVAVLFLLALSALLSAAEAALTGPSRARLHALEGEPDARARLVDQLLEKPERIVGTVLFANTLARVLAVALMTALLFRLYGAIGVLYAALTATIAIVIFADVLPRTYALAYPERTARLVAPFMWVAVAVLTPATNAIAFLVRQALKLTRTKLDDEANILAAHREIRGAIELQTLEGGVARTDAHMLGGVLDLGELEVSDIMVHRTKMQTFDVADAPRDIIDEVLRSQYTRVPIWKDEPENIVGVLNTKDLLGALARVGWDIEKIDIMSMAATPWFVPDTTSLKDQLNQFLKKKAQMALVVDEYGDVQGLVTLEDILEEIVGQITDEHDAAEVHIRPQADGTVNVDGTVPIRDLNRHMDWDLPDDEATTIAGLVVHEAQLIPEPGQMFTFHGYRMEILRRSRNKITAVRIQRLKEDGQKTRPHAAARPAPRTGI